MLTVTYYMKARLEQKAPHEERPGILGCDTAYASAKAGKCGFYVMRQLLSEKRIGYIIKAHRSCGRPGQVLGVQQTLHFSSFDDPSVQSTI